jgi:hypothetical protein
MAKNEVNFLVKTKVPGTVKGRPVIKIKIQKFTDKEKADKCQFLHQQKKELFIEVIDYINNVKTVYTKTLREKNYTIRHSKIIV